MGEDDELERNPISVVLCASDLDYCAKSCRGLWHRREKAEEGAEI
jgi:hypothetical protein